MTRITAAQRKVAHDRLEGAPSLVGSLFKGAAWLYSSGIAAKYRKELEDVAKAFGLTFQQALLLNLDYELGGGACTTASVPDQKLGQYRFVRALDWDVPEPLANAIRWSKMGLGRQRRVPGYVGAVTAHSPVAHTAVALNQSPNPWADVNMSGKPISWIIREAVEKGRTYEEICDLLIDKRPIVGGYLIVVGPDKACWLELTARKAYVCKEVEFPELMVVCNDLEVPEDETDVLEAWSGRGAVPFPVYWEETADIVNIAV